LLSWKLGPTPESWAYWPNLAYQDSKLNYEFREGDLTRPIPLLSNVEKNWDGYKTDLLDAYAFARSKHAQLVVVYLPSKEEAFKSLRLKIGGHSAFDEGYEAARRRVAAMCAENNIDFLDLTPILQQHAEAEEQLYFSWDGHWNVSGHHVVAQAIYEYLNNLGLLPES
jgi:hypothetical protein